MTAKLLISLSAAVLITACTPYRPEVAVGDNGMSVAADQRGGAPYMGGAVQGGPSGARQGMNPGYRGHIPMRTQPRMGQQMQNSMRNASVYGGQMQGGPMSGGMTADALYKMNQEAVSHPEINLQAIHQYNMARDQYANEYALREAYMGRKSSYKYGTLGAVAYDLGSGRSGLQGRVGYQTGKFYGAELEGSYGVIHENRTLTEDVTGTIERDFGVSNSIAGFGVARFGYSDKIDVLARAGYHATQLKVGTYTGTGVVPCVPTVTVPCPGVPAPTPIDPTTVDTRSETGIAYGIGLEAKMSRTGSIRGDLTVYDMGRESNKAFSVAYVRRF